MNFVEHNFVSNEEAKNILEAYGYEVKDAVVEESAKEEAVITENACTIVRGDSTFILSESVEVINDAKYIEVFEVTPDSGISLDEATTTILESVELENKTFTLGELFEDQESGEFFVQLDEEA